MFSAIKMKNWIIIFLFGLFWGLPSHANQGSILCKDIGAIAKQALSTHIYFHAISPELKKRWAERYIDWLDPIKMYLSQSDAEMIKETLFPFFDKLLGSYSCNPILQVHDLYVQRVESYIQFTKRNFLIHTNEKEYLTLEPSRRERFKSEKDRENFYFGFLQYQFAKIEATPSFMNKITVPHILDPLNRFVRIQSSPELISRRTSFLMNMTINIRPLIKSKKQKEIYADFARTLLSGLDSYSKLTFSTLEKSKKKKTSRKRYQMAAEKLSEIEERPSLFFSDVEKENTLTKLALLKIPLFYTGLTKNISPLLQQILEEKTDALLLDLSFNPGGDLQEILNLLDIFSKEDLLLQIYTRPKDHLLKLLSSNPFMSIEQIFSKESPFNALSSFSYPSDKRRANFRNYPMAILINGLSSSGSELISGTLKDHGQALLIGSRTFGKGVIRKNQPPFNKINLFTITGFYFLPSGISPHRHGIEPHIVIPSLETFLSKRYEKYALNIPKESPRKVLPHEQTLIESLDLELLREQSRKRLVNNRALQAMALKKEISCTEGRCGFIKYEREETIQQLIEKKRQPSIGSYISNYNSSRKEEYLNNPRVIESMEILLNMLEQLDAKNQQ